MAALEGEVLLAALARRVKRIKLRGPHTRRLNNRLRAPDTLPLNFIPARSPKASTMPDITFILADGGVHGLEAPEGVSVMAAASGAGIPGIVAECGGSAICATCHVYVDPAWVDRLPAPLANELALLDCTATERLASSRLSCQIKLTAALQGLVVHIPERQQ